MFFHLGGMVAAFPVLVEGLEKEDRSSGGFRPGANIVVEYLLFGFAGLSLDQLSLLSLVVNRGCPARLTQDHCPVGVEFLYFDNLVVQPAQGVFQLQSVPHGVRVHHDEVDFRSHRPAFRLVPVIEIIGHGDRYGDTGADAAHIDQQGVKGTSMGRPVYLGFIAHAHR